MTDQEFLDYLTEHGIEVRGALGSPPYELVESGAVTQTFDSQQEVIDWVEADAAELDDYYLRLDAALD